MSTKSRHLICGNDTLGEMLCASLTIFPVITVSTDGMVSVL